MKTLLDKEDLIFNPPQLGCVLSLTGLPGGGSKIYDKSPYGNNDAITGATWIRLPSGLWCLSLDGNDDYVDCGNNNSLRITGSLTLAVWVKPADNSINKDVIGNTDYGTSEDVSYRLTLGNAGLIEFRVKGATAADIHTGTSYSADVWQHIVGIYDTTTLKIFKNGVDLEAPVSGTVPSSLQSLTHTVYVGAGRNNSSVIDYHFNGLIALPSIHNTALSALEIQNLFNREKHLFGVW